MERTFDDLGSDPEDLLSIEDDTRDGHPLLVLDGELDPHSAPELERRVDALFADGASRVSLDLQGLTFIDSSGLRVILSAHKAASERGGALVLCSPSPTARRLLDITGLLDHLEVAE